MTRRAFSSSRTTTFSFMPSPPSSRRALCHANVLVAPDCGVTGFHRAGSGPPFQIRTRPLQAVLPLTLGLSRDPDQVEPNPHFHRTTPLGTQPMVRRPRDIVAEAEFGDRVCGPL